MKTIIINPWKWQNNFGYAQAVEVKNSNGTLYCSGQAAMDAEGKPVKGQIQEQINLSLDNLEQVIHKAGYQTANMVRINFYTTSIPDFFASYGVVIEWLQAHRCTPASTLVQVESLAFPELKIEIEATVVN